MLAEHALFAKRLSTAVPPTRQSCGGGSNGRASPGRSAPTAVATLPAARLPAARPRAASTSPGASAFALGAALRCCRCRLLLAAAGRLQLAVCWRC